MTDLAGIASPAMSRVRAKPRRRLGVGGQIAWLGLAVLIVSWIVAVHWLKIPSYILPKPEAVVRALWSGLAVNPASPLGYYLPLWSTLSNAAVGCAIGVALGLVIGSLMAELESIE